MHIERESENLHAHKPQELPASIVSLYHFYVYSHLLLLFAYTMADFKYGVNTDVNIGVSVTRGGNTLFEVMGIC